MSAQGYDSAKDKLVHDCGTVLEDDFNRLSAAIYQYGDKGKPKIQITREKFDNKQDKWIFAKLGRLNYEEFVAIAKAAKEGFDKVV